MGPKLARNNFPSNDGFRRNARCSLCINKIGLVQLNGEFGSRLNDDIRLPSYQEQNSVVSVYEERIYRLNVQLDCGGKLDQYSSNSPCSRSLQINFWIDYNDNQYDDRESRILLRSWSNIDSSTGEYYIDISIPSIDGQSIKSGSHSMTLTVLPSDEYQRECGTFAYQEIVRYIINIIPKPKPIIVTRPPVIYRNPMCSVHFAKIILVLMAGEKGTQIRDDFQRYSLENSIRNKHHMDVTLFENTVYLIRIQLDCSTQSSTDLTSTGCNLAQDVIVSIDQNDDGIFDQSENGTPYRWPITSYLPHGIYDLQIYVPFINDKYLSNKSHRMRILVKPTDYFIRICGHYDYSEIREYNINIIPPNRNIDLINISNSSLLINDIECSSDVGKLVLVVMAGEYRTQIRDDPSITVARNHSNRIEEHHSIVLYEDTIYLLRIQLECIRYRGQSYSRVNCTLPHDVNAWIDLNDDGIFDQEENAAPYRWPITSYIPQGIYDLQIHVPILPKTSSKSGPHQMRLTVSPNQEYQKKCNQQYYTETRNYTVTILQYNPQEVDIGLPGLSLNSNICSEENSRIVLVIMTGVLGTHIRDDTPLNTILKSNQNGHHMSVTLYENTIYRIRIQLDCLKSSSRSSYDINCNHVQDLNVFIDLNNDGIYDQSESQVNHRWPLYNSMGLGIYDIDIPIPIIDGINSKGGAHRMRVHLSTTQEYQQKCGENKQEEIREYTINIIPRTNINNDFRERYCLPGNFNCQNGNSGIYSVQLIGEELTRINDQSRECLSKKNYYDHQDLIATLYDNTVYKITIQLFCIQDWPYRNLYNSDSSLFQTVCNRDHYIDIWIDLNNDGIFDQNSERINSIENYGNDHRKAQYDLQITIPTVDQTNYLNVQHRMRIILSDNQQYRKPCNNIGYGEARDYTLQLIPKPSSY